MEFDILLLLTRRPGQVFTARQIYEAVAADSYDAGWTGISSMVYKLRRKLGADNIETVRAMATVSHQNSKTAPPRLYRGGDALS